MTSRDRDQSGRAGGSDGGGGSGRSRSGSSGGASSTGRAPDTALANCAQRSRRVVCVVTAKAFASAKQRLSPVVPATARARLAEALLANTLEAVASCREIDATVAVVGCASGAAVARARADRTVEDASNPGQSGAAELGASIACSELGASHVVLLPADIPLVTADALATLVHAARSRAIVIVPDRHGTGTNALALSPTDAIRPSFGDGSCERHRALAIASGRSWAFLRDSRLALDIDTVDDLAAAASSLAGRSGRTAAERELADAVAAAAASADLRLPAGARLGSPAATTAK